MEIAQLDFNKLFQEQRFGSDSILKIDQSLKLGDIVSGILPYLFAIAGILLLLFLIYGGISLMLSRGDPKAVQSAKDKITGALFGFIIVFIAFWLVQIVGTIFGLEKITDIFK